MNDATASGDFAAEPKTLRPGKKRKADLSNRLPILTCTDLAEILRPILASKKCAMPTDAALKMLSTKLELCRINFEMEFETFRESHSRNAEAQTAIETLERALMYFKPSMQRSLEMLAKSSAIFGGDEHATQDEIDAVAPVRRVLTDYQNAIALGERLERDLAAIKAPSKWFVKPPKTPRFIQSWPDYRERLDAIFCEAVPSIGRGKTKGTLNRCLAAVIPSITGETPTLEAIDSVRRGIG